MIVIVNDLGDIKKGTMLAIEWCTGMGGIGTGGLRAISKMRDTGIVTGDLVDGAKHGDRCIINPNNSKDSVVNNGTRELIPLILELLINFKKGRELLIVDAGCATGTNLKTTQVLEQRKTLKKKLSM